MLTDSEAGADSEGNTSLGGSDVILEECAILLVAFRNAKKRAKNNLISSLFKHRGEGFIVEADSIRFLQKEDIFIHVTDLMDSVRETIDIDRAERERAWVRGLPNPNAMSLP